MDLMQQQQNDLSNVNGFDQDKINVIRNTVAKGADNNELEMFLHLAKQYNLDPLAKEIWFIKKVKKQNNNGNWDYPRLQNGEVDYTNADTTIMTSRDGYVKIAHSNPAFKELSSMEIRENDDFHYNAFTREIRHNITAKRGRITGAWAICKRKDMEPAFIHVDFQEYKNAVGKSPIWDKYPSAMIRKIAEVIVLKRQFNISGLVTAEEMHDDYTLENAAPTEERRDITPVEETQQATPQIEVAEQPEQVEVKNNLVRFQRVQEASIDEGTPIPSEDDYKIEWVRLSHLLKSKLEVLNIKGEAARNLFTSSLHLDGNTKEWTLNDLKKAIQFLNDLSKPAMQDPETEQMRQEYAAYEASQQKVMNQ